MLLNLEDEHHPNKRMYKSFNLLDNSLNRALDMKIHHLEIKAKQELRGSKSIVPSNLHLPVFPKLQDSQGH